MLNDLIIAHRGLFDNIKVPENSISAFKNALKKNLPIELDVQLTSDNKLVVFHDESLYRMTKKKKILQETTYDELTLFNLLDTTEKIPLFKDVLKIISGKVLLDIEIKNTNKIKETCEILMNELKDYNGEYIIKSFNPKIVHYFKKHYPNVTRGLLITDNYHDKFYNKLLPSKLIRLYCKPNFLAISKKLLKRKQFKKLVKKMPILVWTVKNKNEFKTLKKDKLSLICNNLPY